MFRFAPPGMAALALALGTLMGPAAPAAPSPGTADAKVCKFVVGSERGAKPFEMCLTKAEWDAKRRADARNVNRQVCRYTDVPGDRFRSRKVCMTAAEWENQRQLERQAVERIQSGVCVPGAGC